MELTEDGRIVCNQQELAEFLSLSARQVHALIKSEGLPLLEPGKPGRAARIDLQVADTWYRRRELEQLRAKLKPGADRAASEGTGIQERTRWQARHEELKARKLAGELVDRAEVADLLTGVFHGLARAMDAVPGRIARQLAGMKSAAAIRELLLDELRRGRTDALATLHREGLAEGDPGGAAPPARKDAKRVGQRRKSAPRRKRGARTVPK